MGCCITYFVFALKSGFRITHLAHPSEPIDHTWTSQGKEVNLRSLPRASNNYHSIWNSVNVSRCAYVLMWIAMKKQLTFDCNKLMRYLWMTLTACLNDYRLNSIPYPFNFFLGARLSEQSGMFRWGIINTFCCFSIWGEGVPRAHRTIKYAVKCYLFSFSNVTQDWCKMTECE